MQKFDAVLFDLDGTLIDSAPGILATFQKTFEAFGLTVGEQRLRPFLGPPLRSSMAQLLPQAQVEQAVETYRELYQTHGLDGCAPYAGVPQMLQALREAGFVVCVATSKPYPVALRVLRHFGLATPPIPTAVAVPLLTLVIFLPSFLLSWLIHKIPVVGRYLT